MATAEPTLRERYGNSAADPVQCPACNTVFDVHRLDVMPGVSRYDIRQWADVIIGRRSEAFEKLRSQLQYLIVGLVEQLSARAQHEAMDLRQVQFEIRWVRTGEIVIELSYRGRRLTPLPLRY